MAADGSMSTPPGACIALDTSSSSIVIMERKRRGSIRYVVSILDRFECVSRTESTVKGPMRSSTLV